MTEQKVTPNEPLGTIPLFNEYEDGEKAESSENLTSQRTKGRKNKNKRRNINRSATTP